MKKVFKNIIILFSALFFLGCSQLSLEQKNTKQQELDAMAKNTIAKLIEKNPEIQSQLDNSKGYVVVNWKVVKVPIVGVGNANGVVYDKVNNKHVYIKVKRFDIGGGWGVRSFKNLLIVDDEKILKRLMSGTFEFRVGAEVAAGTASVDGDVPKKGMKTHVLLDAGGSATATVRLLVLTIDKELN